MAREVSNLEKMGVDIELNMVIGKVLTIPSCLSVAMRRCSSPPGKPAHVYEDPRRGTGGRLLRQ